MPIKLAGSDKQSDVAKPRELPPHVLGSVNTENEQQVFRSQRPHDAAAQDEPLGSLKENRHIEVHRVKAGQNSPLQFQKTSARRVEWTLVSDVDVWAFVFLHQLDP